MNEKIKQSTEKKESRKKEKKFKIIDQHTLTFQNAQMNETKELVILFSVAVPPVLSLPTLVAH